jgi:hypothetical protein
VAEFLSEEKNYGNDRRKRDINKHTGEKETIVNHFFRIVCLALGILSQFESKIRVPREGKGKELLEYFSENKFLVVLLILFHDFDEDRRNLAPETSQVSEVVVPFLRSIEFDEDLLSELEKDLPFLCHDQKVGSNENFNSDKEYITGNESFIKSYESYLQKLKRSKSNKKLGVILAKVLDIFDNAGSEHTRKQRCLKFPAQFKFNKSVFFALWDFLPKELKDEVLKNNPHIQKEIKPYLTLSVQDDVDNAIQK